MNIFDRSPILRVLEQLGESPDGEASWWADTVAKGLQEASLEPDGNDLSSLARADARGGNVSN